MRRAGNYSFSLMVVFLVAAMSIVVLGPYAWGSVALTLMAG